MIGVLKKRRFLLMLLLLVTLTGVLFGTIYEMDQGRVTDSVRRHSIDTISIATQAIDNELSRVVSEVTSLAQHPLAKEFFCSSDTPDCLSAKEELRKELLVFGREKRGYMQVRLLDTEGVEKIRAQLQNGQYALVGEGQLQNKSSRLYVQEGLSLEPGQIYVSKFDLNEEYGVIEIPFNPTIRFVVPVYSDDDDDITMLGLFVVNYKGNRLLNLIDQVANQRNTSIWLVNKTGYFMRGPTRTDEWGFMFEDRQTKTIKTIASKLEETIKAGTNATLRDKDKLYAIGKLCDLETCSNENIYQAVPSLFVPLRGSDFPWTLVSSSNATALPLEYDLDDRTLWLYLASAVLAVINIITILAAWKFSGALDNLNVEKTKGSNTQKRLQSFIANTPFPVYLKDPKGKYLLINNSYAQRFDKPEDEILGVTDFDLMDAHSKGIGDQILNEQHVMYSQEKQVSDENWTIGKNKTRHYRVTRFPVMDLDQTTVYIGSIAIDMTDLDKAEANLADRQILLETLIESAPYGVLLTNMQGEITFVNHRAETMLGYERDELLEQKIEVLVPDTIRDSHVGFRSGYSDLPEKMRQNLGHVGRKVSARLKNGDKIDVDIVLSPVKVSGEPMMMSIVRDVSKMTQLENHIRQSQKMEAVGQLSGGIAHDFNNLLGVIIGNLDLLDQMISDNPKAERRIATALKAALSGAELTKRLLAFSRKQALNPKLTDMKEEMEEMRSILERSLKTDAQLVIHIDPETPKIFIDPSELQNVILNMCINARDATKNHGIITIEVRAIDLDKEYIEQLEEDSSPGRYVLLTISDNGTGMSDEVAAHIFEPFFTTKEKNKGTGLGLAMVHGFVRQSKGIIKVYSELDRGTSFHIYLPAVDESEQQLPLSKKHSAPLPFGTERILIVDDEIDLSEVAQAYLDALGYKTRIANSAEEAITILETGDTFDLVVSDIVMPGGMDGLELYECVSTTHPELKFMFASGFSEEALLARKGGSLPAKMISKPFDRATLVNAVRSVLDGTQE